MRGMIEYYDQDSLQYQIHNGVQRFLPLHNDYADPEVDAKLNS